MSRNRKNKSTVGYSLEMPIDIDDWVRVNAKINDRPKRKFLIHLLRDLMTNEKTIKLQQIKDIRND